MMPQPHSRRFLIGPLITLVKRVSRKMIHWYVWPQTQELRARLDEMEQREAEARHKLLVMNDALNKLLHEFARLHDQMAEAEAARLATHAQVQTQLAEVTGRRPCGHHDARRAA